MTTGFEQEVEPLGKMGPNQSVAAGAASAQSTPIANNRVSIRARGAEIRVAYGANPTATSTSHPLAQDERLDLRVDIGFRFAAIRAGATDGTLEILEIT